MHCEVISNTLTDISLRKRTFSGYNYQEVRCSLDVNLEKVFSLIIGHSSVSDYTVLSNKLITIPDILVESLPEYDAVFHTESYNILDRWRLYTYDLKDNIRTFNVELPKR